MAAKHRNITRMDHGRGRSWWVRLYRGTGADKVMTSASFADSKHGGKGKALQAAIKWRDRKARELGTTLGGARVPLGHGYLRRITVTQKSGRAYPAWVAYVRVGPRKWASTKRSINLWGDAGAKRRCEAWLRERRRKLRGRTP